MKYGENLFSFSQAYQIVSVTNHDGTEKKEAFYENYVHTVATRLRYDRFPTHDDCYRMRMDIVQDKEGKWAFHSLHTSTVQKVEKIEQGIKIYTRNSIYTLHETALIQEYLDEANLIELYFNLSEPLFFCRGIYYDDEKRPHELTADLHLGYVQNTVLIGMREGDYLCRYYLQGPAIMFYNTFYNQQDYCIPFLIHNIGKRDIEILFEDDTRTWTIPAGENKKIYPS